MYADAEKLLVGWLANQTGVRCCTELPGPDGLVLPIIQIVRYGGSDNSLVLDRVPVDIDCYAMNPAGPSASRADATALAAQVRELMLWQLPGYRAAAQNATVARVRTINAPRWAPYDNTSLRRFHASYMVTLHNH